MKKTIGICIGNRTFDETVSYFEWLAYEFSKDSVRAEDKLDAAIAAAKSEAYELAAFELVHNMEHTRNYATADKVFADLFSGHTSRERDASRVFKAGNGTYYEIGTVRAAFTFEGVRYVSVRETTNHYESPKRYRTLTLDHYMSELEADGFTGDHVEHIRLGYIA